MGIRNFFKEIIDYMDLYADKDFDLEEFSKDKLSKEKWLEHYFKIYFERLEKETDEEFEKRVGRLNEEVMNVVVANLIYADRSDIDKKSFAYRKSLKKNVTTKIFEEEKNKYFFLIRFVDSKKNEDKEFLDSEAILVKNKSPKDRRSYHFSPYQSLIAVNILPQIQLAILGIFGIGQHENITHLIFDENRLIVTQFDGVQFFSYPLEKRIELFLKYPEVDELLFGLNIEKFLKWVLEKREQDEYMKKYCEKVDELIKKYKIEI